MEKIPLITALIFFACGVLVGLIWGTSGRKSTNSLYDPALNNFTPRG